MAARHFNRLSLKDGIAGLGRVDRLDAMSMFTAVADEGSLVGAARKLGRSPATLTRAVASLEAHYGQRLLHRTTRSLSLTEFGREKLEVFRRVLEELSQSEGGGEREVAGVFSLTASELLGRHLLLPVVESFIGLHPRVRVRLLFSNRVVDLAREGIDAAIRLAELPDSNLISVPLGEVRRLVCASPDHLSRAGVPQTPAELVGHECISEGAGDAFVLWRFHRPGGRPIRVRIEPRIALTGTEASIDSAVRGAGYCQALSYQVADHLEAGRLVTVLDAFEPSPTPVQIVFGARPRRTGVLPAFIDFAAPVLRAELGRRSNLARRG